LSSPRDRNDFEAELRGELDTEMPEPSEAEHRDRIARPAAAVAQGVKGGDAGAHQWRGLEGG